MDVIAYGANELVERQMTSVAEILKLRGRYPVIWVNVNGLGDTALVESLGLQLGLHQLALEDVINTHQRPKVDVFDDALFVVARMADLNLRAVTEQLSMFIGRDFVLTFQEEPGDCWQLLRARLRHQPGPAQPAARVLQFHEHLANFLNAEALLSGFEREHITRQRRRDNRERISRIPAKMRRVGEHWQ